MAILKLILHNVTPTDSGISFSTTLMNLSMHGYYVILCVHQNTYIRSVQCSNPHDSDMCWFDWRLYSGVCIKLYVHLIAFRSTNCCSSSSIISEYHTAGRIYQVNIPIPSTVRYIFAFRVDALLIWWLLNICNINIVTYVCTYLYIYNLQNWFYLIIF